MAPIYFLAYGRHGPQHSKLSFCECVVHSGVLKHSYSCMGWHVVILVGLACNVLGSMMVSCRDCKSQKYRTVSTILRLRSHQFCGQSSHG